ncbi:hypothetical protein B0I35DRAFT_484754 [Stachybotrys elegans]|uniref:Uncharacterized protein n=1 Tax=Stachybotrys elegans TaxID=80388 RepID=A0A8K0WJK4_9HYPO|nr:hypothetical protein B0I35DRAFT_484754 [Stachybotrys elegans]
MIAAKFLVAMAACIRASPVVSSPVASSPVASALEPTTTNWTPGPFPPEGINWDHIDMDAFKDPANWKETKIEAPEASSLQNTSSNPAKDVIGIMSGPCDQGCFPDFDKAFDALWTLTVADGSHWADTLLRIGDCGQCHTHTIGSGYGGMSGGCWDFRSCGRDQQICVDPGNRRAHRLWKGYVKTCYQMEFVYLGSCGPIEREILRPVREVACNW